MLRWTKDGKRVSVFPETDDDTIVVTGRDPVRSMLGDGADRYTAGDGTDVVWAGYTDSSFDHVDHEADVIRTGDGRPNEGNAGRRPSAGRAWS